MARIESLKKEKAQQEAKEILEGIEKQFGMIPNLFAAIAHYPKALKPILDLYQAIANVFNRFNGALQVELEK